MANSKIIPDADERRQALDPSQSFIVQAPAGSGKTALLIQRYLKLLTCVDAPEEVVAITFTRKAAAEMRTRVLAELEIEHNPDEAETTHEKLNQELAAAVLLRDQQAGWYLIEHPERLRIQTIDSLCASLTRQMPMLSKFGAQPETIEDATDFYLEAVRVTLELMQQDHAIAHDVEQLLEHLDNDMARVETLLIEMLAQRDHWLRHIHAKTRQELEESLQNLRYHALQYVLLQFPKVLENELLALLRYAAINLTADGKKSSILFPNQIYSLSSANVEHWYGIAELLLTREGSWRKKISINEGFPSGNSKIEKDEAKKWKNRWGALVAALSSEEVFRQALHDMRLLPPPYYTDRQWKILGAITRLLPNAVAQLKIIFQTSGFVDFSEVTQRALLALGESEFPTDLALALDYRIQHLLIDEFQDTSISQYKLIEKLIAGWEMGDGRSLFAVGDPMQSIYRFREAEVGLFLQARNTGIGHLVLQPITLSSNFRSQRGIIDWVNETFTQIMPIHEEIESGAVPYTPSTAIHSRFTEIAVKVYPLFDKNQIAEANQVVEIIQQTRCDYPTNTIAILVRNRSHLQTIVQKLKESGLRFRAIDIELLHYRPVVQDLLVLTRALINLADKVAWFALLRAPWCGFLLKDIDALLKTSNEHKEKDCDTTINETVLWQLIDDPNHWCYLSDDAKARIERLRDALAPCIMHRERQSLRMTVEAVWQALGGPGCINPIIKKNSNYISTTWSDAMIFLDYLEMQEEVGTIRDLIGFEKGLNALYASQDLVADDSLQIMTIHKAKGLEFDTVIVPGLGREQRKSDKQLLKWMEQPHDRIKVETKFVSPELLLAPIQETGLDSDPIYRWMEKIDCKKEQNEADRLLYVAATRARKFLHLLGHVNLVESEEGKYIPKKPAVGSLLHRLWPVMQLIYFDAVEKNTMDKNLKLENKDCEVIISDINNQGIYRLKEGWALPDAPKSVAWKEIYETKQIQEDIEFSWAGEMARHVGNVVHRWLKKIADDELRAWDTERIRMMHDCFKQNLLADGMSGNDKEVENAIDRIILALINAISDERGRWILGSHRHAKNELRVVGIVDNKLMNCVIDRTFTDSRGVRWIIDYKTGSHEGADVDNFLNREQIRYYEQLNYYAKLMRQIDSQPIKLGIYFPLIKGWREWE
ncbi:UvrD-helicase domain-containing protein [Nitrosomonas ureae]|uniref:DNA 3'-5' helicase n=1 Tax=Nitrosomonas ureae TaxID=44577 RepID=A0A286AFT6_9PROT|nr:UvrD-helicase domain-containing protein [Nitrosomonas ureae]SOD20750.1 ATP-dependent exoDNAse (exonuclease V) beta subunit (contains helicase and exonuclease domains) [Nitrosomonas ureae]